MSPVWKLDTERKGEEMAKLIEILFVKRHLAPDDLTSVTFNFLGAVQQATPVVGEGQAPYQTGEA